MKKNILVPGIILFASLIILMIGLSIYNFNVEREFSVSTSRVNAMEDLEGKVIHVLFDGNKDSIEMSVFEKELHIRSHTERISPYGEAIITTAMITKLNKKAYLLTWSSPYGTEVYSMNMNVGDSTVLLHGKNFSSLFEMQGKITCYGDQSSCGSLYNQWKEK